MSRPSSTAWREHRPRREALAVVHARCGDAVGVEALVDRAGARCGGVPVAVHRLDQHAQDAVGQAGGGERVGLLDGPHAGLDADAGVEQRRA